MRVVLSKYVDLHKTLTSEMERQLEMLKNMLTITLEPTEANLALYLKETTELPGIIESLEEKPGSARFGEVIAKVLSGVGVTCQYAIIVDRALKKMDSECSCLQGRHNLPQILCILF